MITRMPEPAPFDYTRVTADAIPDRAREAMRRSDALLDAVVAVPDGRRTLENTLLPLDAVSDEIAIASGRYGFLTYVSADAGVRKAALEAEQALDTYATAMGFREDVNRALRAFADSPAGRALEGEERRLLEFELRDYRRNGFDLPPDRRARVQALKERLVQLGTEFRRNIDEYQEAILVTREQLAGLPESFVRRLRTVETDAGTRFRVSLDYPEFYPFMEAAEDGALRRELFMKNHNKAAGVNLPLLAEAIAIRDEVATLLGYASWAHYVLEIRMAKEPRAALDFLVELEQQVRVKADRDIAELAASKARHLGVERAPLEIWDWRYYQQRVLREQFEVDAFKVAEYFPLEVTLEGMFGVYQRLVGVRFVPVPETKAWHPDVRLYAIEDARDGSHIAHFYMDLHPRPDKYGHAAAFNLLLGRRVPDGRYQAPASAIVANFTKPTADSPSLLRHSEVETLFHEFGHILHQTMTRSRFARFAGTRVERDYVEAPSQMLEHWVWDRAVLAGFTRHVESGEPLPADLLDRMIAAKNVASGVHYLRQLYFARLDLAYHLDGREKDTDAIAEELHGITGFPFPRETHFQAGFGHLFGYDAGYYGYLWSQVFGDDMFTRFEGAPDPGAVGADYRRVILERGGTRDAAELIREFLGREPRNDAFLREIGLG
ncbi:MAG: Zn-dependent oligopeptidase [Chloroflexi bacterium]|nr:Zn-dependent oligopeptidase [Chloroflexota bacterium]